MKRGLRLRLALTHAAVAALAVVVVALIVNYTGERRFDRYVAELQEQRQSAVVQTLAETYRPDGWDAQAIYAVGQIAELNGVDVAVYDTEGELLFTVEGRHSGGMGQGMMGQGGMGTTEHSSARTVDGVEVRSYPIEVDGETVARADVYAPRTSGLSVDESFRSALNRNLVLAAVIAGVLALLVSVVVARRITGPLEELTDAAEEVATGNLEVRVAPRSDDEVGALAAAFNQMADALARDEQWRRDMTADLAHELRTPLATIQARVEALEDGVLPPTPANLRVIGEEVERLGRLLGDLRSLVAQEGVEGTLERLLLAGVHVTFEEFKGATTQTDVNPNYIRPKMFQMRLQKMMDEYAGGVTAQFTTSAALLTRGLELLAFLQEDADKLGAADLHELMRCWENVHRMYQALAHVHTVLFREETRWPGYYFRADKPKLDEENWHCFVNCKLNPASGEWEVFKRPILHMFKQPGEHELLGG